MSAGRRRATIVDTSARSVGDRCVAIALLLALAVAGVVLFRWHPNAIAIMPDCPTRAWLGLECPGCGSTRAVHHLLNARISEAWRHNPATILLGVPALGLVVIHLASVLVAGRGCVVGLGRRFGVALVIALVAYFAARNLPFAAFEGLRPPAAHAHILASRDAE